MGSLWTSQPGKGLYTVAFYSTFPLRLAFLALYYIPRSLRPHPAWPYKQALGSFIFGAFWHFGSVIEYHPDKSLEPGSDGDRFILMEPGKADLYRGVLDDKSSKPRKIGGMWYPRPISPNKDKNKTFIIHFHGGAFVMGGCRQLQGGFAPETLAKTFDGLALAPQYRMAWESDGHFPAPIQDGITAYNYVLSQGIRGENIILSGDSAGGNIAIAVLRYLEGNPVLPKPRAVFMWSPWVDLRDGGSALKYSPHYSTEWIPRQLPDWGLRDYLRGRISNSNPYVSPVKNEFATKVPIFVQTCDQEVLYEQDVEFAEGMQKKGAKVECHVIPNTNHDAFAAAPVLGTKKQAEAAAAAAYKFVYGQRA